MTTWKSSKRQAPLGKAGDETFPDAAAAMMNNTSLMPPDVPTNGTILVNEHCTAEKLLLMR